MKYKILFLSKHWSRWHICIEEIIKEQGYEYQVIYLTSISNISNKKIIELVRESSSQTILFDLEFSSILDEIFLLKMKNILSLKYIFLGLDDNTQQAVNKEFFKTADLILSPQYRAIANYKKTINCPTVPFFFELNIPDSKFTNLRKINTKPFQLRTGFYGSLAKGRKEVIEHLNNNIGVSIEIIPYIEKHSELSKEILDYDVIINFSQAQTLKSNRFYNTFLFKKVLRKLFKQPDGNRKMTEFKGRIIECLNLQVLCVSEYFDYYEEYFPNNEMLVYKDDAELAIILEKLQNKDYYDRALKKFLSVLDSKSTSIFVSYLNNFDMQLFTVVSNPPKACYKLKLNLSGKIYSKIDMITIRGYRLLKKYSKLLSVR